LLWFDRSRQLHASADGRVSLKPADFNRSCPPRGNAFGLSHQPAS
jgi:hypothetical protein